MTAIEKQHLIDQIICELTKRFEKLCQAAKATYDGAIHEESKAEDKYDTRGLEASYLAGAQARRASEMEEAISLYMNLKARAFGPEDPLALSAVVQVETDGKEAFYFMGPDGGGMKLHFEGKEIVVITPKSPLGSRLIGKLADDEFDFQAGGVNHNCTIISVY